MKYNMSLINRKACETKYNCDEIYILFADDDDYLEKGIIVTEDTARFIIRNIDSIVKEEDYAVNNDDPDPVCINWNIYRNVVVVSFIDDSTTIMLTNEMMLQFQTDIMKLLSGYTTKIVRIE